jgi:hypothetical protein
MRADAGLKTCVGNRPLHVRQEKRDGKEALENRVGERVFGMKLDVSGLTVREFNETFARAAAVAVEVVGSGGNVVVDCKMVWDDETEL